MSWNKFLITHDFLKITEKVSEVHPLTFRKLDGYGTRPPVPPITAEDLPKIEQEMKKIVKENLDIVRKEVSREEAIRRYEEIGDHLKIELIHDIPEGEVVSIYEQGEFFDLCRGVHVPSTGKIKEFKLLSVRWCVLAWRQQK